MYCEFYQLTERPFNVTPDPKFLYLNARYREAIASLNYGITQRKGFITLIGEAGTGKTTLLKKLLEDLDSKTKSVFIFNTNVSFEEILEYIFAEFDLPVHNGKKLYMLQRLNAFLLEELRGGGNVALLIDEAQDLEFSVLEDLRLLSNLETAKEKILQIVLSGQPELGQKLSNPVLRQLRQRIGINCRLLPLSRDEITEYIHFRLQAGGSPDLKLFTREAEDQIYHFSRGIPRLVNVVCDNALVIGYALGKKRIGADIIGEAAADLLPAEPAIEVAPAPMMPGDAQAQRAASAGSSRRSRFGLVALVAVAVVIGLWSVGRTMREDQGSEPPPAPQPSTLEVIRPGSAPHGAGIDEPPKPTLGASRPRAEDADSSALEPGVGNGNMARGEHPDGGAKPARAVDPDPVVAGTDDTGTAPPESVMRRPALAAGRDTEAATMPDRPLNAPDSPQNPAAVAATNKPPAVGVSAEFPGEGPHARQDATKAWQAPAGGTISAGNAAESADRAPSVQQLDSNHFEQLVVHDGDSMSEIARRKYGQSSYTVLDLLKLANPEMEDVDVIAPGETVQLPELRDGFPVLTDGAGRYALLVFSTPNAGRANTLSKALRGRGFDAHVSSPISLGAQKSVYRVTVAGAAGRDGMTTVGHELQKLFREDTRIAQLGE
jgi:type II secretory pathway predicted ATPase ExeA